MLLFILFAVLLVASTIYYTIVFQTWKKKAVKKYGKHYQEAECFNVLEKVTAILGPVLIAISGIAVLILSLWAAINQGVMALHFTELQLQYTNLTAIIESGTNLPLTLAADVADYNTAVLTAQHFDNLWTNWYTNTMVAELPLIVIGG